MKTLTVRTQLMAAFGGLAALIVTIAGIAIFSFFDQYREFEHFVNGVRLRAETSHLVREAVDLRAIAARNLVLVASPRERSAETQIVRQAHADVGANLLKLNELAKDASVPDEARRLIDKITQIEKSYAPVALAIVDLALNDKHEEAIVKMNDECRPLLAALITASREYAVFTSSRSAKLIEEAGRHYAASRNMLLLSSAVAIGLAVLAGVLIMRGLLRALGAEPQVLCAAVAQVASGDLAVQLQVRAHDNSSVLAALQRMQASLSTVVNSVRQDSELIATAAGEISSGNNDLSSRTEQQASSLEETASSMEELTSTVRQNADHAREANALAVAASNCAIQGGAVVEQVVGTMGAISDASRKIVDIISVIDGIAFQTNILALNAAVEAARAGEQGRGFAVVAAEVRSLAQRSASAAKEIKGLIDNSVERVDAGTRLAAEAGATMSEVVTSVGRVASVISEIMSASHEQSAGIEQVNQAIIEMDNATQQNASLVEQAAAAAESLHTQAGSLVRTVSVFKVASQARETGPGTLGTPVMNAPRLAASANSAASESKRGSSKPHRTAPPRHAAIVDWAEF